MRGAFMPSSLALAAVVTVLSANAANAAWCGSATRDNAIIECGYATVADCQQSVGKDGYCFVDPDLALKSRASSAKQFFQDKG
jgi:Protein of unknown function (DUF3551)